MAEGGRVYEFGCSVLVWVGSGWWWWEFEEGAGVLASIVALKE